MELIIRNTNNQPIYEQICTQIKAQIKELEDYLSAAVELAAQCGVSSGELTEMLHILQKEDPSL